MNNVYIGMRYVPLFDGTWNGSKSYEPLIIVQDSNNFYTSKQFVPAGTPLSDTNYWVLTGNLNGALLVLQNQVNDIDNRSKYNKHFYNIEEFGGVGDGVTDNTSAILSALSAMTDHDSLYFPSGNYVINSNITITKAIEIFGDGCTGESTNPNWSGMGATTLSFYNSSGDCITIKKTGEYICGFHMHDLVIRGSSANTDNVISLYNGSTCIFERMQIRNYDQAGIALYAEPSMLTSFTNINNCSFVYGVHTSIKGGSAIIMDGGNTKGVTQSYVENISCLSYGYSYILRNTDNNNFIKCYGYSANSKTMLLDVSAQTNYFNYFSGSVEAKAGSVGNVINHYISEGGSVSIESGATLYYNIQNYINGDLYAHDSFYETKTKYVSSGEMSGLNYNNTGWEEDLIWNVPAIFAAAGNGKIAHTFTDKNMDTGKLKNMRLYYMATDDNSALTIKVTIFSNAIGSILTTADYESNINLSDAEHAKIRYVDIPVNVSHTKGDTVTTIIESVAVTSGKIGIVGFAYDYVTDGPSGAGMGSFDYVALS